MQIAKQGTVVIKGEGETFELVKKEVFISGEEVKKRAIIESVNDELKNICQIEHTRHRSFTNFGNEIK